jgi:hypothetical protein
VQHTRCDAAAEWRVNRLASKLNGHTAPSRADTLCAGDPAICAEDFHAAPPPLRAAWSKIL